MGRGCDGKRKKRKDYPVLEVKIRLQGKKRDTAKRVTNIDHILELFALDHDFA